MVPGFADLVLKDSGNIRVETDTNGRAAGTDTVRL